MGANNVYRVTYHFEKSNKRVSETFQDNVLVSATDLGSINTVLSNNSKTNNGNGSVYIESIEHLAGAANILS